MRYIAAIIFLALSTTHAFEPPIGIPDPADYFGAFGEIDQAPPAQSTAWPSEDEAGY